jgi:hypothetical protein
MRCALRVLRTARVHPRSAGVSTHNGVRPPERHVRSCVRVAQFGGGEPCLERAFRGHRGGVSSLAFNPNMRQLVSGGLDGDVLVWNFKPSLRAYRFAGHTARARHACERAGGIMPPAWRSGVHAHAVALMRVALSPALLCCTGCGALGCVLRGQRAHRVSLQGPHHPPVAAHRVRARAVARCCAAPPAARCRDLCAASNAQRG